jgi:hypothetical protein
MRRVSLLATVSLDVRGQYRNVVYVTTKLWRRRSDPRIQRDIESDIWTDIVRDVRCAP